MADLSAGLDDKDVSKTSKFSLFGRSPARTPSRRKGSRNFFKGIISGGRKSDVSDDDKILISSANEPQEKIPYALEKVEEGVTKVINEMFRHDDKDAEEKKTNNANPDVASKESTPAADHEKKHDILHNIADKAKGAYETITHAHDHHDDKGKASHDTSVIEEEKSSLSTLLTHDDHHQHEVVVAEEPKEPETEQDKTTKPKENQQEDNCIVSLAEGLQKICGLNKKED